MWEAASTVRVDTGGKLPFHSFGRLDERHTGGFHHLVCLHGVSENISCCLNQSVRGATP